MQIRIGKIAGLTVILIAAASMAAACGGVSGTTDDVVGELPADGWIGDTGDVGDDVPDATRPDTHDEDGFQPGDTSESGPDGDAGCGEDTRFLVDEGFRWLQMAQPVFALENFEAALELCPDDVDGRFGAGLSSIVYGAELVSSIISIATGQLLRASSPTAAQDDGDEPSRNEYLAEEFHRVFMGLRGHFTSGLDHLELIEGLPLSISVEQVPVHIGIKPLLMLRGEFDEADVLLIRAVTSMIVGLLDLVTAQDLNTDVLGLVNRLRGGFGGDVDFKLISETIAYFMDQDERFLTLHPTDGRALLREAGRRMADVAPLLAAVLEKGQDYGEAGTQVSFVDTVSGGWILTVRSSLRQDAGGGSMEEPMEFVLTEDLMEGLHQASDSLLNPGQPVTLHGSLVPALALILATTTESNLLAVFGIELPAGLDLSALEVPDIAAILKGLLPNVLAFDWGGWFDEPAGLRSLLPATTGGTPSSIVASWECPEDVRPDRYPTGSFRMLCAAGSTLEDKAHFEGTAYETTPDGTAGALPLFGFPDPTGNGLFLVDLEGAAGSRDASTYEPATNTTLNAAISALLAGILALLG
jgi:hypothetical protein